MKTVQQTSASLGSPMWAEACDAGTVIARWQHGDGRIDVASPDALRVVLSLSSGQHVRHAERDRALSMLIAAGDVTVLPAGVSTETAFEGETDVVQIFFRPECIGLTALTGKVFGASISDALKVAVIQLLVAVRHGNAAEAPLRNIVRELRVMTVEPEYERARGGLAPMAMRGVDELIADAIDASGSPPANLTELAATAGVSINHFIRAFRTARGTTPHQYVLTRRCQRAMNLLRQPDLTVAAVGDEAGYSSRAHFVASFRQRLGVTPGAYQRAVAKKR